MHVCVPLLQRLVLMLMAARLRQVQRNARQHRRAAGRAPAHRSIAERDREQGANDGREGEHRTRSNDSERALRRCAST